jgi:hypothetical protein
VCDFVGGDEQARRRQSCGANPYLRKRARAGGDDGPAVVRQSRQQLLHAGQRDNTIHIIDLRLFDDTVLRFVIGIGKQIAQRGDAGASVRMPQHLVHVEAPARSPARPYALHRGYGVDEHSIHIEQQSLCGNSRHASMLEQISQNIFTGRLVSRWLS